MAMRMEDLLAEDEGYGDITSDLLIGNEGGAAEIVAGEDCVVAGLAEAVEVFQLMTLDARPQVEEGCEVKKGAVVMTVKGSLKAILLAAPLAQLHHAHVRHRHRHCEHPLGSAAA